MLDSCTYAWAALELAREGRWSVAYWLLERAARTAPVELLGDYLDLAARARSLATRKTLLTAYAIGQC